MTRLWDTVQSCPDQSAPLFRGVGSSRCLKCCPSQRLPKNHALARDDSCFLSATFTMAAFTSASIALFAAIAAAASALRRSRICPSRSNAASCFFSKAFFARWPCSCWRWQSSRPLAFWPGHQRVGFSSCPSPSSSRRADVGCPSFGLSYLEDCCDDSKTVGLLRIRIPDPGSQGFHKYSVCRICLGTGDARNPLSCTLFSLYLELCI